MSFTTIHRVAISIWSIPVLYDLRGLSDRIGKTEAARNLTKAITLFTLIIQIMKERKPPFKLPEEDKYAKYYAWFMRAVAVLLVGLGMLYASSYIMDGLGRTVSSFKSLKTAIRA